MLTVAHIQSLLNAESPRTHHVFTTSTKACVQHRASSCLNLRVTLAVTFILLKHGSSLTRILLRSLDRCTEYSQSMALGP